MPSLRRPVLIASLLAAALATGVGALVAEDIDPAAVLDSVKASYEAKKYGKALSDLQLVLAEIGRLRMEALKVKLPGAPSGWTAEEAEGQSGGGIAFLTMGTNVKRRYTKGEQSSMEVLRRHMRERTRDLRIELTTARAAIVTARAQALRDAAKAIAAVPR